MNPRRVHELLRKHFPPVEHAARNWLLVQNEADANLKAISSLLAQHIASADVVIEVHRKLGALVPISHAPIYIANHIGQGEIRIADRGFSGFVVVAVNGVATGWHLPANIAVNTDAPRAARPVPLNVGRHSYIYKGVTCSPIKRQQSSAGP